MIAVLPNDYFRLDWRTQQPRGNQVTQAELAELAGVSTATWSTWEAGRSEPPLDTIERVARILGVDPGWLAFGTQPADEGHPTTIPQQRRKLR